VVDPRLGTLFHAAPVVSRTELPIFFAAGDFTITNRRSSSSMLVRLVCYGNAATIVFHGDHDTRGNSKSLAALHVIKVTRLFGEFFEFVGVEIPSAGPVEERFETDPSSGLHAGRLEAAVNSFTFHRCLASSFSTAVRSENASVFGFFQRRYGRVFEERWLSFRTGRYSGHETPYHRFWHVC